MNHTLSTIDSFFDDDIIRNLKFSLGYIIQISRMVSTINMSWRKWQPIDIRLTYCWISTAVFRYEQKFNYNYSALHIVDIWIFSFEKRMLLWQSSVTIEPHVFVIVTCLWKGLIIYLLVSSSFSSYTHSCIVVHSNWFVCEQEKSHALRTTFVTCLITIY